jgi:hypothetical protein
VNLAKFLKADVELLNSGDFYDISLAAKWCPSLDCSFDKSILLCERIARRVFPIDSHPESRGIEDAHYAYRVRDLLRKEVLVPLRKSLELPEVYMSANRWNEIPEAVADGGLALSDLRLQRSGGLAIGAGRSRRTRRSGDLVVWHSAILVLGGDRGWWLEAGGWMLEAGVSLIFGRIWCN